MSDLITRIEGAKALRRDRLSTRVYLGREEYVEFLQLAKSSLDVSIRPLHSTYLVCGLDVFVVDAPGRFAVY